MEKSQKIVLIALAAVFVCIIAACVIFTVKTNGNEQRFAFSAPAFDASATHGDTSDIPQSAHYKTLTIKEDFKISVASVVNISDTYADVYFTSDSGNTPWLKIQLLTLDGELLGESGLIKAGEHLKQIQIDNLSFDNEIIIKILSFEPDTYYSLGTAQVKVSIIKEK